MIGQADNSVAKSVIDRFEELDAIKRRRTDELTMVARLYRPNRQGFYTSSRDNWNLHDLYNSTTLQVSSNANASLYSTMMNPANTWFKAGTIDEDLAEWHNVKEWLDIVSRVMRASFSPAVSNFYSSAVPWMADTTILGTGAMVSSEASKRQGITDQCFSPADFVCDQDADGLVNEFMVERQLNPRKAAGLYGAESLPPKVREKLIAGKNDMTHRYIQAYQPNDDFIPGRIGPRGMEFLSTHVCVDEKAVVRQRGTFEQSFSVPRYDTDGDEDPWGRGMGYLNLASAVKLQVQEKQNQQAGSLAARPPIGTTGSRSARRDFKLAPGKALHGAFTATGQQVMKPIFTFNGLPVTIDMARMSKEEVENGWHAALLSLVGRTGLGNLEVIERTEERLRLLAPYLGNVQTQGLTPILERRFAMLFRAGQIPPPPPEMKGQPLDMKFTSVAAMAQKAQEGVAISRVLEDTYKLAAAQPTPEANAEVWDAVDMDYTQQALREARGAPARMHRSPEEIQERREQRAQQAAAQQALATAEQGASIGADLANIDASGAA